MTTIRDIYDFINEFAPYETQEGFDNSGFLIGNIDEEVTKVVLCLDITTENLSFAKKTDSNLILSHHPVIFSGLKFLYSNNIVYSLIENKINALAAHTNLDKAIGGIDDCLAKTLGLINIKNTDSSGIGRIGELEKPMNPDEFKKYVKNKLGCHQMKACFSKNQIKKVATICGCGDTGFGSALDSDADAIITGDMRHQYFIYAKNADKTLIDAGHFETEIIGIECFKEILVSQFPSIQFEIYEHERFFEYI